VQHLAGEVGGAVGAERAGEAARRRHLPAHRTGRGRVLVRRAAGIWGESGGRREHGDSWGGGFPCVPVWARRGRELLEG
jgi:hypothetical protein